MGKRLGVGFTSVLSFMMGNTLLISYRSITNLVIHMDSMQDWQMTSKYLAIHYL